MNAPAFNLQAVDEASRIALIEGHRILATHRYDADDRKHVETILAMLNPPQYATIMDVGCGFGEVSRIMAEIRSDLDFMMVNISEYQISQCPVGPEFISIVADAHRLPDCTVDAVMYNSALTQLDISVALIEAHRVLSDDGILLINDMERTAGDNDFWDKHLGARVSSGAEIVAAAEMAGFELDNVYHPSADDSKFREHLGAYNEVVLHGVQAAVWRFVK